MFFDILTLNMPEQIGKNPKEVDLSPTQEDWESYQTYRWFMEKVGGSDRMVPRDHGLSWMLRIHHREITDAVGAEPEMAEETADFINSIDGFYEYSEGDEKNYIIGNSPTTDATPAKDFFIKTAFGPKGIKKFKNLIDAQVNLATKELNAKPEVASAIASEEVFVELRKALAREYVREIVVQEIRAKFFNEQPVLEFF